MTLEELRNGFRELGIKLYSHQFTERRRDLFQQKYREAANRLEETTP
jgi:hypothetical protein